MGRMLAVVKQSAFFVFVGFEYFGNSCITSCKEFLFLLGIQLSSRSNHFLVI